MILKTSARWVAIFSILVWLFLLVCLLVASASAQQDRTEKKPEDSPKEDWTTLSVSGLGLKSLPPMPGGKSEFPEFTRELVRLEWRHADPVDIFVVLPHGVSKPRVILYLYGYPSDTTRFTNDQWCKTATEGGFAAVGFVSALTGERYQGRPMKQWFVSELQESLGKTTHDVQKILDYLAERGDMNVERVGMYAQGSGASIAILAASVDQRIAVLDLLNPWGDWPDWLKQSPLVPEDERPTYLRPEFLEKVAALEPIQTLPKLSTRVVRIQQVADDLITPKAARERIAEAVPRGAQSLQYENGASLRKAWQEKKLWNWAKEQMLRTSPQVAETRNLDSAHK